VSGHSYDLIARLGRGGMGVVDLARDEAGQKVALKRLTLHGSAAEIARARQRLLREAEVLRKLHHPNIVRLLDVIDEGDEIVLVMPYMAAGSLAERVAQHGPAPAAEVERQARRLIGALASAHRAGIVHRDIKPANVLFDDRGEPCLADFGVAISRDHTHGLTATGMVVGTPGFMAPEQARGEQVTPATDVFSLGATLLFAATGEGPFGHGDPALLMVRAASGKVAKVPRHLPASLRRLLRRMLDPRPERRPTAEQLADDPEAATADRSRSWRVWALVAGGLAAAAVAAGMAVGGSGGGGDGDSDVVRPLPMPGATDPTGGEEPRRADADEPCADLPYQPCGASAPAPNTDGTRCLDGYDDYDGDPENGCEAEADDQDGRGLDTRIEANIVPRDDVDRYPLVIEDPAQHLCAGEVEITLEAPPEMTLVLEVVDHSGTVVAEDVADEGVPATVVLGGAQCDADADRASFEVVVRADGPVRTAEPYVLTRTGSF
jgi:hypothetical protein